MSETLKREQLEDGGWLLSRARAQVCFRVPKPGVVVIGAGGPGDTVLDDAVFAMLEEEIRRSSPLKIFADLASQTRVAGETREKASAWAKGHRQHIAATHLLVRSRIVEMAFSVIGMLVGGHFKFYSNEVEFYSVLRAEVPGLKARSFRLERSGFTSPK